MKTLDLGSVSSGTMRPEDLIPAFVAALREVASDHDAVKEWDAVSDSEWERWCLSEEGEWFLEDLFDALNEYVPAYCYFGAHEGDGADYGVWISEDAMQDAIADGEVVKVSAGDPWPCVEAILEVTDHGNMTLWVWDANEGRHVEAWAAV